MKTLNLDQVVAQLKKIETEERKLEEDALEGLALIARHRHYQKFNCKSLFDFCVQELGYSKAKASRRSLALQCLDSLSNAKRSDVLEKIHTGSLTLTHLVQAQSVFRKEKPELSKKEEILNKLENKSTRESERILVQEFGVQAVARESFRPISETETKVSLVLDQETLDLLTQFKNLSAHENPYGSNALALKLALKVALKAKDPMLKKIKKVPAPEQGAPETLSRNTQSNLLSSSRTARGNLRVLVWKKYQGRCGYMDTKSGSRCSSRYMLEVDHILPV